MTFQDHFSNDSDRYRRYRPTYPAELYDWLVSLVDRHDLCWDVATGQGQAALGLADRFAQVIATDASEAQLAHAPAHPNVEFRHALAEASELDDDSVDLVTAASALHWFANEAFYEEAKRVIRPGGVLAAWSYGVRIEIDPAMDAIITRFAADLTWPADFELVRTEYQTLGFPFRKIDPPKPMAAVAHWTLSEFLEHVRTWSGYQQQKSGPDPLPGLRASLQPLWGTEARDVRWPLFFAVARMP